MALCGPGLEVNKGFSSPPHVNPYRFLGTPDLNRYDTLLPKTFQFAERMKFPSPGDHKEAIKVVEREPMVLPLTLKGACWNGERWEGTSQTASEAKRRNGFDALYSEVVKSEKRVILCKTGHYFLEDTYAATEGKERRNQSIVSKVLERQHKSRASVAKPFIPPLQLKKLPLFEQAEELGHNQEILSAYREESHRYSSARLAPPAERTTHDNKVLLSGRTVSGLPLKACGETSLRQLGNILHSNTSFRSMQNLFNGKLMRSLSAIKTMRPYHYAHEYSLKPKGDRDPFATPHRAVTFRKHLVRFQWYENLIELIYANGRYPSKSEIYIIEDIRHVLDQGERYTVKKYIDLILELGRQKMDTDSSYVHHALLHIQNVLKMSDLELLTNLMLCKARIPLWLESKTKIVKQAIRDLSSNRFPMSKWMNNNNQSKTPVAKLGKLFRMTKKGSTTSRNSLVVGKHCV